ncbi:pentapeptide repeat-containing protein [Bradyrhizobium yuanmingense]|uniref:pentapeptide repeat-containing protein n=1 Tax=Bradyrhizobium yuanmingense TaxID=108015 RepID=UPI0034E0439D
MLGLRGASLPGVDFLRAVLFKADLFKADLEREFIVWETCVQQSRRQAGASRFKRALIGFGQSAPIRDR